MKEEGFTLLELLAVIAIMALLSCAVVLKLAPQLSQASTQGVLDQIERSDQLARLSALQAGKELELVYDVDKNLIYRREEQQRHPLAKLRLPDGFRIEQVRLDKQSSFGGEAVVRVGPGGYSASYAVALSGRGGFRTWLVFAGLSGQVKRMDDEMQVQSFFRSLVSSSDDAH